MRWAMTKRAEAVAGRYAFGREEKAKGGGEGRRGGLAAWRSGAPVLCGTDPQGVGGRTGGSLPCVG